MMRQKHLTACLKSTQYLTIFELFRNTVMKTIRGVKPPPLPPFSWLCPETNMMKIMMKKQMMIYSMQQEKSACYRQT